MLKSLHKQLVAVTLHLGGTFYLPYRHHYSLREMQAAYGVEACEAFSVPSSGLIPRAGLPIFGFKSMVLLLLLILNLTITLKIMNCLNNAC